MGSHDTDGDRAGLVLHFDLYCSFLGALDQKIWQNEIID